MTYDATSTTTALLNRSRLGRGLAGFAALSIAGLGVLFVLTVRGHLAEVVRNLSAGFLALAALSMVADFVIGAIRYQIFLRRIRPGTSLWLPIKADLANRFTGAVTPSQTGGGPAQVFILYKGGIPVPAALSFLMINFVSTLVFFLLAGSLTAWWLRDQFSQGAVQYLIQWGFVAFAGGLAFMILGLVRPDLITRLVRGATERLERLPYGWARVASKAGRILVASADSYREKCMEFTREAPWLMVGSFALTVVLYLNKFTLAWFVMRGLGVNGDYALTLAVQALLHFILYVAPTPGGSGIAELSTGALMAVLLPTHLLGPFTLAYRAFLLYVPAAVGAVVLAQALRPKKAPARKVQPAAVGVVVSLLILAISATVGARPASAQRTGTESRVPMTSVRPLMEEARAAALGRQKELLFQALAQGRAESDEAAAELAFSRAVEMGRFLVEAAPDDADAHYLLSVALGLRLETAGLREKISMGGETRREAEVALALDPDHPGAHHVMGRLHAGTMRLNRVARFVAQRLLGAEAMAGVSWQQAEYHFRRAQAGEPENPRHAMELGALYIDTHRPDLALVELRRATSVALDQTADTAAVARAQQMLVALYCAEERCSS